MRSGQHQSMGYQSLCKLLSDNGNVLTITDITTWLELEYDFLQDDWILEMVWVVGGDVPYLLVPKPK